MRPDASTSDACLYVGRVVHRRSTPVRHAFRYRLALLDFELGKEQELERLAPWFGVGRRAPVSWRREDHFGDPTLPLDVAVRDLVALRTGRRPRGAIRLLTSPRVFGYGFNPISLFFCHDDSGSVEAIVAEVTSTPWAERHCYVLAVPAGQRGRAVQRFVTPKQLHVSPFLGMRQDYRWRIAREGGRLSVGIAATSGGEKPFSAAMSLERTPLRRASLARFLFEPPLGAAGTMAAIHLQALRLWWKGVPYRPHPGDVAAGYTGGAGAGRSGLAAGVCAGRCAAGSSGQAAAVRTGRTATVRTGRAATGYSGQAATVTPGRTATAYSGHATTGGPHLREGTA